MFIQSFIFCIVAIMLLVYNMFYNRNYYKQVIDKQQKVLYISNIITFRNSLFDYCNSLDLTDLKYEIENNDLVYIDRLLQIKNKIDNYYKQINESDIEEINNVVDDNITDTDIESDIDTDTDTDINTDVSTDDDADVNTDVSTDDDTVVNTDIETNVNADVNTDIETNVNTNMISDDNIQKDIDHLLQIKNKLDNKIDNYYKQINNDLSDNKEEDNMNTDDKIKL